MRLKKIITMTSIYHMIREFALENGTCPEKLGNAWIEWSARYFLKDAFELPGEPSSPVKVKPAPRHSLPCPKKQVKEKSKYSAMTAVEMRAICKERGLQCGRTKVDLESTLVANDLQVALVEKGVLTFRHDDQTNKFLHLESNLLFDKALQMIVGIKSDGAIGSLSNDDVAFCRQNNLEWDPTCVSMNEPGANQWVDNPESSLDSMLE